MQRALSQAPHDKHSVAIPARHHRGHFGLARRQPHGVRLVPELVPPWLKIFVKVVGSVCVRAKNKMLSSRRPDSAIVGGVLWPMLGKRKWMWITAVHVE